MWKGGEHLKASDKVEDVLKQGTLGMGFIGLAEALVVLRGKHHGECEKSQELGLKIVETYNRKAAEFAEKYDLNYSVIATPAESLSGNFTKKDKAKFGTIEGINDRGYYTNSSHIPVYYDITASKKIELEAPYHKFCGGGSICYIEMDVTAKKNLVAFMHVIKKMIDEDVNYGSINHTVARCLACGYEGEMEDACPKCGEEERLSRIARINR